MLGHAVLGGVIAFTFALAVGVRYLVTGLS
jgi:hypothetical protein